MKGRIECPTRIITVIPHGRELARSQSKELSVKAKFRLTVFDWYYQKSPALSITGVRNASLTCRHFGNHHSLFYYWLKRYNKQWRCSELQLSEQLPYEIAKYTVFCKTCKTTNRVASQV